MKRGRGLGVLLADGLVVVQELTNHVPAVLRSSFGGGEEVVTHPRLVLYLCVMMILVISKK